MLWQYYILTLEYGIEVLRKKLRHEFELVAQNAILRWVLEKRKQLFKENTKAFINET